MSKITAAATVLVVGLFMVGVFAAPVNALTATAPTWQVGDTWAMGKEVDLGSDLTDNLTGLNTLLSLGYGITIDDLDVDSKASAYMVFTVASETATTYTLTSKMAVKFATQADVKIAGNMPVAGSYDADEDLFSVQSSVPKESKVISLDLTEKLGVVVTATATVNKTSYALNQLDWTLRSAVTIDAVAKNIPQMESSDYQQNISYKDYDVGLDLVANANLTMVFSPALDVYQFPFSPGDDWETNESEVSVTGAVSGFLDITGLTTEQKEQMFSEELVNATGSTDFPIKFDHLTSPDGEITDGEFGPYNGTIPSMFMECLSGISRSINGVEYSVFVIQVDEGTKMVYSPGFRLIGMSADSSDIPADLPSEVEMLVGFMGEQDMELEPVATATATSKIASIETYTDTVAAQASNPASSNSLSDFFFKAPFVGIIMVIIAGAVVAVMLYIGVKARKK